MKFLELLRKYVAPSILAGITVDSYRRQVYSHQQDLSNIKQMNIQELTNFQEQLWGVIRVNSQFQVNLQSCSSRISDIEQNIYDINSKLGIIKNKLNSAQFAPGETINSFSSMNTYYSQELIKLHNIKNNYITELQTIINNVSQSDVTNWLSNILTKYQSLVDNLGLEQLVALFNIIWNILLLMLLTSISILLIGDYIIEKCSLDTKWPKIARYIKMKIMLNKYYLIFYIILFFVLLIVCIFINIYMLMLKYFI